jgi:uncharacterized caspase-like protein
MTMTSRPYDIFRKNAYGQPVWVEAVENPEKAKLRVIELGARVPGQYMVYWQQTGQVVSTMTTVASSAAGAAAGDDDGWQAEFAVHRSQSPTTF